ncbi:4'-phosphopantetheinyl transferase superfamily protein [Streptomyces sp. PKU-EA00015]|uniref:4'-phosphopantetheinyl transferase superfamily protein n=1 Tax=Streptomyces sp. PKU-EA00015 TaxID=2748326 RepID=UPI0015A1BA83|nr:4'-phosphopantetheinyl transferase superfamily protein [Streptomyces sp. PKU-EA00015]NWF30248.1 4'-phosphopantetheinyl transferase superfamily protein [Streptomyces sp. PKU-EA00015]
MAVEPVAPEDVAPDASIAFRPVPWPHGPAQQSTAGRRAAAAALASAGSADRTVPREPDGRPRFPRGFTGSISHTDHLAVAVVVPGAEAVGVDIETATVTPRMAAFVLRERERHMLLPPAGEYTPRDLFVAKEAAFKALNGLVMLGEFLFWRIELHVSRAALTASYGGESVRVWVHSEAHLSLAVAIRR